MLILERVCQLVSHDGLLAVEVDPVGEVELLRLRVVVAGDLLGQKLDDEGAELKVRGDEAELLERRLGGAPSLRASALSLRLRTSICSISARDCAPLRTGRRTGSLRSSLVSRKHL